MKILAIETSCDETAAAVVEKKDGKIRVLSNVVASSIKLHAKTGGIIPDTAAREQVKYIIPVITKALIESESNLTILPAGRQVQQSGNQTFKQASNILKSSIDAIVVTIGPGLIGSLLIGVETAKTLSYSLNIPLIPVNHLLAHIFANFIDHRNPIEFPFIGLIVSGGHTDLLMFKSFTDYTWLGGTRDDAAGEALDKIGRILGLPYPAGPEIEKRAEKITSSKFKFSKALKHSDDFDFSFSGLKTEAAREIKKLHDEAKLDSATIDEICFAIQESVVDVLVTKTTKAAKKYNAKAIVLGGGVSANQKLINEFKSSILKNKLLINLFSPEKKFTTDNAAMIGAYALLNPEIQPWQKIKANPNLYFS